MTLVRKRVLLGLEPIACKPGRENSAAVEQPRILPDSKPGNAVPALPEREGS
jgi:hypothetical protein